MQSDLVVSFISYFAVECRTVSSIYPFDLDGKRLVGVLDIRAF